MSKDSGSVDVGVSEWVGITVGVARKVMDGGVDDDSKGESKMQR